MEYGRSAITKHARKVNARSAMKETGLEARFSDIHETNCRSMSWLLMPDPMSKPPALPHARKTRSEHALDAEVTVGWCLDISGRAKDLGEV